MSPAPSASPAPPRPAEPVAPAPPPVQAERRGAAQRAWLAVPLLAAALVALRLADVPGARSAPGLLLALNVVFSTLTSAFVAWLAARSFLVRGAPGLLLLGCGAVAWGASGAAATAVGGHDFNIVVTVHNLSVLLSGLCHLAGVLVSSRGARPLRGAGVWLAAAYLAAIGAVGLVASAAAEGALPTFFVPGEGGTALRQWVLGAAIALFSLAALVLGPASRGALSAFSRWYAVALGLAATGLFGVLLERASGDATSWLGRATQYLGGVWMALAAIASVRETHAWEVSLETALRETEARLQTVVESLAEGVVVAGLDGRVLHANRAALRMHGLAEAPAPAPTDPPAPRLRAWAGLAEFSTLEGAPLAAGDGPLDRILRGETVRDFELRVRGRDGGGPRILRYAGSLVRDDGGRPLMAVLTAQDVTERKQAEQALRESEERYSVIHDRAPFALALAEADARLVGVNDAFLALFGLRRDEVLGRTPLELDLADPASERRVGEALRRDGAVRDFETTCTTRAGVRRAVSMSLDPVVIGGRTLWLATVQDVTERRRMEEALREADRRKNEFLAVLSHELRNPLAPIRNSLHVLERAEPGAEAARRALAVMDRQVAHLSRLVDDLLDVTRITRGKLRIERAPLDLVELARRAVEDQRSVFERAGVRLEARLCEGPLPLDGDATRLAQAVGNLLQNAAKFTGRGGATRVTLERDAASREAVLRVADTGAGLSAEMLARVFEPFAQDESTLERSRGGLGLGLALVKAVVELHGGRAQAASEGPGRGAEFVLRLPLSASPPDAGPRSGPPRAARPLRVLVVEDNVDAAESMRDALELGGHAVDVAWTGTEGLARARQDRPDVVVCDIGLPGMNGYEVARALRADPALRGTFLVALSGYALPEDVAKATDAGFDRHLAKPPGLAALDEVLAEASARRG